MLIDGKVVSTESLYEWGRWMEKPDRHLAKTKLPGCMVSTVFLGLDHGFGMGNLPVLWETMVFGGKRDQECYRYTSENAARAGHEKLVLELIKDRNKRLKNKKNGALKKKRRRRK